MAAKLKLATVSLAGCFGCHMSLLDIDERLLQLLELVEFDRSPIDDIKQCGPCDLGLIEGGICNAENVHVLREFRKNCKILVAIGACAVNGGLPAQRNHLSLSGILEEIYVTGTGLAPYISMLRTMLMHETQRKFIVLHGARYSWDLGYRGELESLARLRPNFTYIPSITRPDQDPHFVGRTGRIQTILEQGAVEQDSGLALDPAQAEVFLCGNPEMVKVVKAQLEAKGFTSSHGKEIGTIHSEEYW